MIPILKIKRYLYTAFIIKLRALKASENLWFSCLLPNPPPQGREYIVDNLKSWLFQLPTPSPVGEGWGEGNKLQSLCKAIF